MAAIFKMEKIDMTPLTELMTFADKQGFVFYDGYWYNLNYDGAVFTTQDLIKLFNDGKEKKTKI